MRGKLPIVFAWLNCVPYLWLVLNAFRSRTDITASPPSFDLRLTLENFSLVYNGQNLLSLMFNSLVISSGTVALSLLVGAPAAYYFARHRSMWSKNLFLLVLSTRMAPGIALSLPMFVLFTELGMRGTYQAVIIAHTIFNIAFVVWFLEGFFFGVPIEIEMAAQADGRSRLGALTSVVLPLLVPALTVAAAFVFLFSWNEYMLSSLLTSSTTRPITPALPGFIAQATSQWGAFCAVAFVSSIPALLLTVAGQRFFARAFTFGMITES